MSGKTGAGKIVIVEFNYIVKRYIVLGIIIRYKLVYFSRNLLRGRRILAADLVGEFFGLYKFVFCVLKLLSKLYYGVENILCIIGIETRALVKRFVKLGKIAFLCGHIAP